MIIPIRNESEASLGIMLEPWCDRIDLEPGETAEVRFKGKADDLMIDFNSENFMSLWVPSGATITVRK